jgi:chromosome segregation ATPase
MVPMLAELLRFGIGAFKHIGTIEGALDQGIEQLKAQQGQPQADPEAQKAQAMQQADQAKAQVQAQSDQAKLQATTQLEQMKMQAQAQIEQMKMQAEAQLEAQKQQHEATMKQQELAQKEQFDRWKAELDAATKIMVARIGANPGTDLETSEAQTMAAERIAQDLGANVVTALDKLTGVHDQLAMMHNQTLDHVRNVMSSLNAPKRIIRGPDGRAESVEVVVQQPAMQPQMVS